MSGDAINEANIEAVSRIVNSRPILKDLQPALRAIPGMKKMMVLHTSPPIKWEKMVAPMRGAIMGALIYEELADTPEEAIELIESEQVILEPSHHKKALSGAAQAISSSMPVYIIENETYGNFSYIPPKEGIGKTLAVGVYDEEVIKNLRWMEQTLAPILKEAIIQSGGIDLRTILGQALHMGDEGHCRSSAFNALMIKEIFPHLVNTDLKKSELQEFAAFIKRDAPPHLMSVRLIMAACKVMLDAAHGVENSTIVTTMARNGVEFGIRVSGLGDRWFTAPSPKVEALYFPGYGDEDASPDLGDSCIAETAGLGGFALAGAPATVDYVGGRPQELIRYTQDMYEITTARNPNITIPTLNFKGIPTGIDVRKVVETGITPTITTGVFHKKVGYGRIGAGITRAPLECFEKALKAMPAHFE